MTQVDHALAIMTAWLFIALHYLSLLLSWVDGWLHQGLTRLGVPANLQMLVVLLVDIVLLVAVVRAFGGVARIFAIVFLILLLLHIAAPGLGV